MGKKKTKKKKKKGPYWSAGWLSAESDALRPDGVASEEVEMSAALMGKDGELVPAGRAECDAVHDALLALLDEAAADGADIQVGFDNH